MSFPASTSPPLSDFNPQLKEFLGAEHDENGKHGNQWQKQKYSNSYFTGDATDANWNVGQDDMITFRYRFNPYTHEMRVVWRIASSTVAGAPGSLRIAIPLGKRAAWETIVPCWLSDAGTTADANATVSNTSNPGYIVIARDNGAALTNASNTGTAGQIEFECQP